MRYSHKYISDIHTPACLQGGSDNVVLQKLYAIDATKIDSFSDLAFNTLIFFPLPPARPMAPQKSVKQLSNLVWPNQGTSGSNVNKRQRGSPDEIRPGLPFSKNY